MSPGFRFVERSAAVVLIALAIGVWSGCAETGPQATDEADLAQAETTRPESATQVAASSSPSELLAFIKEREQEKAQGDNDEAKLRWLIDNYTTIEAAADKVLADQQTSQTQRVRAINAKWRAMAFLLQVEVPGADESFRAFTKSLLNDPNPEIARLAREQTYALRIMDFANGKPEDFKALVADLKKYLAEGKPAANHFMLLRDAAQSLDHSGRHEAALELYSLLGDTFAESDDQELAVLSSELKIAANRRLTVLGQPLHLEGITLDGQQLDWSKYQGKVVLVDFWATWCVVCMQEMPNVVKLYQKYHDRGFDVLGINRDDEQQDAVDYAKKNDLPWTNVFDGSRDHEDQMGTRYGATALPLTFLVGRDGKVIAIDVRGEDLEERLAELLGTAGEGKTKSAHNPTKPGRTADAAQ